jgi:hypothetical protein
MDRRENMRKKNREKCELDSKGYSDEVGICNKKVSDKKHCGDCGYFNNENTSR